MAENPAKIVELAAAETGLPIEAVKEMLPLYDFDSTLRESDLVSMQKTAQFLKDNGMLEADVDVAKLMLR